MISCVETFNHEGEHVPKSMRGGDRKSGQKFGENYQHYQLKCVQCGRDFYAARPDALYHNGACRSAAARDRKVLKKKKSKKKR